MPEILQRAAAAGFDLKGVQRRIANGGKTPVEVADASHEVVIVGGGAAGMAVAASLLKRRPGLDIAIIDPADIHYYQPGWTLVGAGVFDASADGAHPGVRAAAKACAGSRRPSPPSSPSAMP